MPYAERFVTRSSVPAGRLWWARALRLPFFMTRYWFGRRGAIEGATVLTSSTGTTCGSACRREMRSLVSPSTVAVPE